MILLWAATAAIVVAGVVALLLSLRGRRAAPSFPYVKRTEFMSAEEQATFRAVEEAISDDYRLFARVRATDVIGVQSGLAQPLWDRAYQEIRTISLPIVVCTRHKLAVTYVILLAHDSDTPGHRKRREFLSEVLEAANIPHVTLRAGAAFSAKQLREHLIAARRRLGVEW